MKLVEREVKRRINEFHFVAQYLYTRFCQANTFTGKLAESIVIDMQDISKDIQKFRKIVCGMTVDYLLSNYGEAASTKKERFESVIHICDTYLAKMKQILVAVKKQVKDANDQMAIQKCDLTYEEGLEFIEALKAMKERAKAELKTL